MLTSKIIPEITENNMDVCGCTESCNQFVQFDLDKAWNYLW